MDKLIDLNAYPVSKNLKALLKDKTTKKNIIFATSVYSSKGIPIKETEQMTEEVLKGFTQYEIQGTTAGTHQSESRGVHAIMDLQQNE